MELLLLIVLVLLVVAVLTTQGRRFGAARRPRPRSRVVEEIVYEDRPRVVEEVYEDRPRVVEEIVEEEPARPTRRRFLDY